MSASNTDVAGAVLWAVLEAVKQNAKGDGKQTAAAPTAPQVDAPWVVSKLFEAANHTASQSLFAESDAKSNAAKASFTLGAPPNSALPDVVRLVTYPELCAAAKAKGSTNVIALAVRPVMPSGDSPVMGLVTQGLKAKAELLHMGMRDCTRSDGSRNFLNFNDPVGAAASAAAGGKSAASFVAVDEKTFTASYDKPLLYLDIPFLYDPANRPFALAALKRARVMADANNGSGTVRPMGMTYNAAAWNCQHICFRLLGGPFEGCSGQAKDVTQVVAATAIDGLAKAVSYFSS